MVQAKMTRKGATKIAREGERRSSKYKKQEAGRHGYSASEPTASKFSGVVDEGYTIVQAREPT